MQDNLVKAENLAKAYFRAKALDGVSFELQRGSILGLLGPNGAGKSTLLKIIAGLVKPTYGRILVDGRVPSRETKELVAYLPEIDHLYGWMTVRETLDFVSSFHSDWSKEREAGLLGAMGLDPLQQVGKLSKGLRARLKIILAMSRQAQLVLLDEPLSGIDVPSRAKIIRAIISEFRSDEQTVVMSTHDVADAENIFDTVLLMDKGKLRLFSDVDSIRAERGVSIQGLMEEEYS